MIVKNDKINSDKNLKGIFKCIEDNFRQLFNTDDFTDVYNTLKEQITALEDKLSDMCRQLKYKDITIRSLQENMIKNQVHKIPQYQKTILELNEKVEELQKENKRLRELLEKNNIKSIDD